MFATVRLLRLLRKASAVIVFQQRDIARLHTELAAAELAHMRISRDLIEQFLIALDTPEMNHDDIRDRLAVALGFYRDEIAVREEHV